MWRFLPWAYLQLSTFFSFCIFFFAHTCQSMYFITQFWWTDVSFLIMSTASAMFSSLILSFSCGIPSAVLWASLEGSCKCCWRKTQPVSLPRRLWSVGRANGNGGGCKLMRFFGEKMQIMTLTVLYCFLFWNYLALDSWLILYSSSLIINKGEKACVLFMAYLWSSSLLMN